MNTQLKALVAIVCLASFTGCAKHELDLPSLTTNPFDADYNGPAIFTLVDANTEVEQVNGEEQRTLHLRVRVHTEYFGRNTPYLIHAVHGGSTSIIQSVSVEDGLFDVRVGGVEQGLAYCPRMYLYNGGARGGNNDVCATAQ